MGKFQINPLVADSGSDSESSTSSCDLRSSNEDLSTTHVGAIDPPQGNEEVDLAEGRSRKSGAYMTAPWAPLPYLRRAWSPESARRSMDCYQRSLSTPEPSCYLKDSDYESPDGKQDNQEAKCKKWQTFKKLTDDMYVDRCKDETSDVSAGNVNKRREVQFQEDQPNVMAAAKAMSAAKGEDQLQHGNETQTAQQNLPNEDRMKFRKVVRKIGPAPWMLHVLARCGVPGADDTKIPENPSDGEVTPSQCQEFIAAIATAGPQPWMLDVVVNQATNASNAGDMKNKDRAKFRKLVAEIGPASWMLMVLFNNGVKEAEGEEVPKMESGKYKMTEEKRIALRKAVKKIGPKKWMVDVVKNQARKQIQNQEKSINTKAKPNAERTNFRQVVKKLGPGRWMLRVLGNNGVPEAKDENLLTLTKENPNTVSAEKRKEMRRVIRDIGPKAWMVDVVIYEAKVSAASEASLVVTVSDQRKFFQQAVNKMGLRRWMFQVLSNNGVPEARDIKIGEFKFIPEEENENQIQTMRRNFRRVVTALGPKPYMLQVLINQCRAESEKFGDDKDTNWNQRKEFRQLVRKMSPGSWMLQVLSNNGLQQIGRYPSYVPDNDTDILQKQDRFRQVVQEIGPKSWMAKVVITQANLFGKWQTMQFPPTGDSDTEMSETEVKEEYQKMKMNRKGFTEMVKQMEPRQWMLTVLFNQGLKEAKGVDISAEVRKFADDENQKKAKRQEFAQYVRQNGPRPWMIKVIKNQARLLAGKEEMEEVTDDEEGMEKVKSEIKNKQREFVFALKQIKLRPWMFKVLANQGLVEADKVDDAIFEDQSPFNPFEEVQSRGEFRRLVLRIGTMPWMVRIIRNQAVITKARNADVLPGPKPENVVTQMEKRKKFRRMIQDMGAEPWMFQILTIEMNKAMREQKVYKPPRTEEGGMLPADGDGDASKAADAKKKKRDVSRAMREIQNRKSLGKLATPHQQKEVNGKMVTATAAGSADDADENETEPDGGEKCRWY